MKNVRQHIALFYIALMLLFKVAGLHSFSHQFDDLNVEHCEVCLVGATASVIPLLETPTVDLPKAEYLFLDQNLINSVSEIVIPNRHLASYLFTRPPPQVLSSFFI